MGKAAERRKAWRLQFLSSLAERHPERFQEEWNRRVDSWLREIQRRAGRLVDNYGHPVPPAFEVVEAARYLLAECGIREAALENYCSIDVLVNECCKTLARHIDGRMYRLKVVMESHRAKGR